MRLGTANTYDNTLANLTSRQVGLADLQEKLSAGKRVVRASDDPTGAAQAERALTRSARVDTEQRALNLQRNSISIAESTLGDASDLLQRFRELVVNAGDAANNSTNRGSIAEEMTSLRDQLFAYANKQDSNGIPLFGGLGSPAFPFTDASTGVTFNGLPGQQSSTPVSIPSAMDGQAAWMNVPTGNGVFTLGLGGANTGTVWTDPGQVINPGALTGDNYTVTFTVSAAVPPVTTYDVVDTTTATPVPPAARPYIDGQTIQFDGLSFTAHGTPANGDTLQVAPSTRSDLFAVMDAAIAGIKGVNGNVLTQNINLALVQVDTGMDRIRSARGQAGELLKRADIIDGNQQNKSIQLEADRSRAEDMDMVKGISEFQTQQTGYSAALQTYAQVQKLSLFNYLG
jgi:flagellar hook-associated protein 3 FlgL